MDIQTLETLRPLLSREVEAGRYFGIQELVLDGDREVFHAALGMADRENARPVARDTLYRMFSSSKNVTGVAAAMCIERGLFSPRDPVDEYLPAFKEVTVGPERRKPARGMLVRDLLNMTSGLTYDFDWNKVNAKRGDRVGTVDFVSLLAREQPLAFDPGDRWNYGFSADVTGALIEVASGKRYGEFLREELFEPLGMKDTGFTVPPEKRARLAQAYERGADGLPAVSEIASYHIGLADYAPDTAFESGGGGLVSTVDDWAQFCRMLIAGGTFNGHRFLSPAGFRFLTTNQLQPEQARTFNWEDCTGHGYGNFFHIKRAGVQHSDLSNPGTFAWGGWLGTQSFVDPVAKCASIFLVQCAGTDPRGASGRVRSVVSAAASL